MQLNASYEIKSKFSGPKLNSVQRINSELIQPVHSELMQPVGGLNQTSQKVSVVFLGLLGYIGGDNLPCFVDFHPNLGPGASKNGPK